MTIYGVRRRVACYVTRATAAGVELLVFDHVDDNLDDPSGTQIPAGGMLPFEAVTDAAIREVHEETGLEELTYVAQLGVVELGLHDLGGPSVTTYVHLTTPGGGPTTWVHRVTGDGLDAEMRFTCRWVPLPLVPPLVLAGGQDAFLTLAAD